MRASDHHLGRLAASLREIDPSTLQSDPEEGEVRWFSGDEGCELFIWKRPGEPPRHYQLVFSRVSVEWASEGGLHTGAFEGRGATLGGRYDPYLFATQPTLDLETCEAARRLLAATSLEPALLAPLMAALDEALET